MLPEFLADAFGFFGTLEPAGTIAAGTLEPLTDGFHRLGVGIERDCQWDHILSLCVLLLLVYHNPGQECMKYLKIMQDCTQNLHAALINCFKTCDKIDKLLQYNEKNGKSGRTIMRWKRYISLFLILTLTLGSWSISAGAADYSYREKRPDYELPSGPPSFTETEVTCVSGGNVLSGTLTRPTDVEGKMPVAILLHGLATDRSWCNDIAWILADNGIASVRFDFAGTGRSDGAQEDMTVSSEVADTLAILDYVESLSFTDTDNIFLVGKSMGGVDAALAAQSRGDEIKAMCLWYPGFGVTDAVRHGFLLGQTFDPENLPETVTAAGYTFGRGFLKEVGELDYASACRSYDGPVLIIHGDRDFIAPIQFSFEMSQEFPDCTLKVIPGGYHGFWGFQEIEALNNMLEFFKENLS